VDNYQQPKRSFGFVNKAYQPLLVNFEFGKRRWSRDEPFSGGIWVVNDLYQDYKKCNISLTIKDDQGRILQQEDYKIGDVERNSAKKFAELNAEFLDQVDRKFYLKLELTDKSGKIISGNDYFFLIGDQEAVTKKFNEMWDTRRANESKYHYGNYYRFYPALTGEDGKSYQSGTENPVPFGYPEK
jgi:beta-mannosidase